jgi:HemY protein
VRVCLFMADLEETQGAPGAVREWLARAARAPRDRAWVADGVVSDRWAPVSPAGKLDAFVWRTPDEQLTAPSEPLPISIPAPPLNVVEEPVETPVVVAPVTVEAPEPQHIEIEAAASAPADTSLEDGALSSPKPPDDPGARPNGAKRSGFRLFS